MKTPLVQHILMVPGRHLGFGGAANRIIFSRMLPSRKILHDHGKKFIRDPIGLFVETIAAHPLDAKPLNRRPHIG
jgi:hypothetical protein